MNEKLCAYMAEHGLDDKGFGELIGKKRIQIYRYRHRLQVPGKDAMQKIIDVTQGKVDPASFYQGGSPTQ